MTVTPAAWKGVRVASRNGKPVGGVREILDGVAGCIVADEISAQALTAALDRWQPSRVPPSAVAPYAVERIVAAYVAEFLREA